MKKTFTNAGWALTALLVAAGISYAQATNLTRVAVINIQQSIVESAEGKKAQESLQQKYNAKKAELDRKQKEIDDLTQALRNQEKNLSDEARATRSKEIDQKTKELNRSQEDATNEFQQLQSEVINTIGNKILRIIQLYAAEQNFSLVLDTSSPQAGVLYANPTIDITTEIIRRMDAQSAAPGSSQPAGTAAKPATSPAAPKQEPAKKP